jgi:hypothetical protein
LNLTPYWSYLFQFAGVDTGREQYTIKLPTRSTGPHRQVAGMRRNERIRLAPGIAPITRPRVMTGCRYHASAHGIELDIAIAAKHVSLAVDQTGLETTLPQCSRATVARIEAPNIAPSQRLHHPRYRARLAGRDQQVHVIGHQYVGMQSALEATRGSIEFVSIEQIVVFRRKARLTIVATLYDVLSNTRQINSRLARHGACPGRWRWRYFACSQAAGTPVLSDREGRNYWRGGVSK